MIKASDDTPSLVMITEMAELTTAEWEKLHDRLLADLDEVCPTESNDVEQICPEKSLFGKWLARWRKQ